MSKKTARILIPAIGSDILHLRHSIGWQYFAILLKTGNTIQTNFAQYRLIVCERQVRCTIDPLNLILLILAILIGLKLRSVLGTRNDEDAGAKDYRGAYGLNREAFQPKEQKTASRAEPEQNSSDAEPRLRVVDEDYQPDDAAGSDDLVQGRGLAVLQEADPSFDEAEFIAGAQRAYEMILMAFAAGDLSSVRGFLGDDVYAGFAGAIDAREAAGETLSTQITRLDKPVLEDARIDNGVVQLDVRYRAELISYVHQGEENAEAASAPSRDLWTFERPLKQDGPNWQLVATQAEA